jgi:hypothetical protein
MKKPKLKMAGTLAVMFMVVGLLYHQGHVDKTNGKDGTFQVR